MYRHVPLRLLENDSGGNSAGGTPQAGDPSSTSPQAGTTPSTPSQADGSQSTQTILTKSADDYEAMIRKLRDENASHRKRNKELEDAEAKRQEADLSAQQKAEKNLAALQKQHEEYRISAQERIVTTELRAQAADLGFADLSDAVRLLDRSELEFDDEGLPTNARTLLERLAKAKPYLPRQQRPPATSGGATNPGRSATAGQLTPELFQEVVTGKVPYNDLSPELQKAVSIEFRKRSQTLRRTV